MAGTVTPFLHFPLAVADISGSTVQNRGEPIPRRYSVAHRLWLDFNDPVGTAAPSDRSLYGSLPTASGLTFGATGQSGSGASFSSGNVTIADVTLTDQYAFHIGFNPTTLNAGRNTLISGRDLAFNEVFGIYFDGSSGDLTIAHGATTEVVAGQFTTANQFYRLSVLWSSGALTVNVDGITVGSNPTFSAATVNSSHVLIGARETGASTYTDQLTGVVDSFHLWNDEVSSDGLRTLAQYEAGNSVLSGTITGSPASANTDPTQALPDEGLTFTGTESISLNASTAFPFDDLTLGVRLQHTASGTIRGIASYGVGTSLGVRLVKGTGANTNRYGAIIGNGTTEDAIFMGSDLVDGETVAIAISVNAATLSATLHVIGSSTGDTRVTSALTAPGPNYSSPTQTLTIGSDGVAANFVGDIYDVEMSSSIAWDNGQFSSYGKSQIIRPATTVVAARLVDLLSHGDLDTPPAGESDPPIVTNQVPAPGATNISITAPITGDIEDSGDGVDGSSIIITIGGNVAYTNSAVQAGFTGTVTDLGNGNFRYSLVQSSGLPDLTSVAVRVQARDLSPLQNFVDTTYSFTTRDERAPTLTNQVPAPGATGVSQSSNIAFRIEDAASALVQSSISATVTTGAGGTPITAISAGIIVAPFNGPGASITAGPGNSFDIILDPVGVLGELTLTTVSVGAQDAAGNTLNTSYSFTTADETMPSLINLIPASGGTANIGADVRLSIADAGSGVDLSTVVITFTVNADPAVTVYTGSAFQSGYTGAVTGTAAQRDFVINPDVDFPDAATVAVGIVADDLAGNTLNTSYSFSVTLSGQVSALTPSTVDTEGGTIITGTVAGLTAGNYTVHVGPLGTTADPVAYSGVEGRANTIVIGSDGRFTIVAPPLDDGGPYVITFVDSVSTAVVSNAVLTVVQRNFHRKRQDFRRLFPPRWNTGPRTTLQERFPQA